MQAYKKYKDSGIDWLGKIPEHWEIERLKYLFSEKKKTLNPYLPTGSISFGKVVYKDDEKIPETTKATYQEVLKGDYLINPLNLNYDLISLRIALSEIEVVVSSGYIVIQNITNLNKIYYKWLLHQYDVSYMKMLGSGVRQTISFYHISNSELPLPPLNEQEAIASFLDEKCGKIDEAISIKETQIEKLREFRQITIHEAVTKGLDKKVKMKDSGIDWIGEIPEHWEVKRLKNLIQNLEGGVSVNGSESESASESEIGVLKTSAVYKYVFDPTENKKVFESDIYRVSCRVKKGAIIISRMNASELVGASGLVLNDYPNLYLPDRLWQTVYSSSTHFNNTWLSIILASYGFREFMITFANGSSPSMKNISKGDYLNISIPIPPLPDQEQIVSYLEEQTSKIDQAIDLKEKQIAQLKEYKQSLINEVVTGKVRVPQLTTMQ